MKKYSEEEIERLKRQVRHKIEEINKEDIIIRQNRAKINEMQELEADKDLYANETRNIEGAEARINRWKELLKADFEDTIEMFNSKIEELNSKAKEMSKYLGKTPTARQIDASLKEEENLKLDEQIKAVEEKKQKKLNTILNYQNIGDDDRVEELKKDVEGFDKEISELNNKKSENKKIIDLNNSKQEDVKNILKEIAGIKKEITAVKGLAEKYEVKLDIKEEKKPEEKKPEEAKTEKTEPAPTEPAKVEPAPTEPAKVEPAPTEPAKVEPEPTEPAKAEPAPAEPEKIEPTEQMDYSTIEKIVISPEKVIIENNTLKGIVTQEVSLSDEEAEQIIEAAMIENDSAEYQRVDPKIVKALSGNLPQLVAYLSACKLDEKEYEEKLEDLKETIPYIDYNLRGIRKSELDFEEKSFIYEQAKKTRELLGDKCQIDIGLMDRMNLFIGKTIRRMPIFKKLFLDKSFLPKEKPELLASVNENIKVNETSHEKFVNSLHNLSPEVGKEDEKTDISTLTPEQKAILDAEAKKMGFTKSDGDVMEK